jgi:hypothetical protein
VLVQAMNLRAREDAHDRAITEAHGQANPQWAIVHALIGIAEALGAMAFGKSVPYGEGGADSESGGAAASPPSPPPDSSPLGVP